LTNSTKGQHRYNPYSRNLSSSASNSSNSNENANAAAAALLSTLSTATNPALYYPYYSSHNYGIHNAATASANTQTSNANSNYSFKIE
jgi:hypothetical protein